MAGHPALGFALDILPAEENKRDLACPHLTIENGIAACGIYANRPQFCKDFPAEPADLCSSDCGFAFVKKDQLAQAELL
jgi:Fe-S-cluster containining protein